MCCHKEVKVPKHPLLIPTQVGTALAVNRFSDFLHDDTGDNISVKNRSYCELTAQYWAWKNIEADYYGFFHYRRYLYPDTSAKYPYCIKREATCTILDKLGYKGFADLIKRYDIIVPKIEDMHISVREHYAYSPFHNVGDLKLAEHVVQEQSP